MAISLVGSEYTLFTNISLGIDNLSTISIGMCNLSNATPKFKSKQTLVSYLIAILTCGLKYWPLMYTKNLHSFYTFSLRYSVNFFPSLLDYFLHSLTLSLHTKSLLLRYFLSFGICLLPSFLNPFLTSLTFQFSTLFILNSFIPSFLPYISTSISICVALMYL